MSKTSTCSGSTIKLSSTSYVYFPLLVVTITLSPGLTLYKFIKASVKSETLCPATEKFPTSPGIADSGNLPKKYFITSSVTPSTTGCFNLIDGISIIAIGVYPFIESKFTSSWLSLFVLSSFNWFSKLSNTSFCLLEVTIFL